MYGVSSSVAPLRRVAMRAPGAVLRADPTTWHYAKPIDGVALRDQYETFAGLVADSGTDIVWLSDDVDELADSVFTYDPSFMTPEGAVVLRPGKALRAGEADLHENFYATAEIPVLGRIEGPATIEGGDCFYLDSSTLAVGRGFRTDTRGIAQLADLLHPQGIAVSAYDLPYHQGPDACLHLMSLVSPLAEDLALVYAPLLPTALHQDLCTRGYDLLYAPEDEFAASHGLSLNVLPTAPRECIAVDGFPKTVELMRAAGCRVTTFAADELCIPCEGGPTCLTRPLWRE